MSTPTAQDRSNALLPNTRCTFCFPCCFGSRRPSPNVGFAWWERVRISSWSQSRDSHPTTLNDDRRWWSSGLRALKKLREWSEIVAGPRWKTFIRRFNRHRNSGSKRMMGPYQYDPLSYALNFDEGPGHNGDFQEDNGFEGFRNFSTRYAVAVPVKPVSTEGGKDVAVVV